MSRPAGFVEMSVSGDVDDVAGDNTIGLLTTHDPEAFPESVLIDAERLERALIAVREEFDAPKTINLALVRNSDGDNQGLALYPDGDRDRAVVLAPRQRPIDGGGAEYGEMQEVER